ncbi:astacin-like metalloprotease toxin 4 [Rhipicephalus sanguineus]|uniref:astacin-like metalloprotease toxin 4 n=1 Tax=Rhipicephalus sanguineus TaxID=34632 RepID=UPI00189372E2|nr:astacin-like metalloprotease toxin 4 [Rhipicephalus sanguineus]
MKKTCIRFVSRADQTDYVHLIDGGGCYSHLGRIGGLQPLSLGYGCLYNGTVAHELLHAAGFYHEHSRPDRDDYIDVFPENVIREFEFEFRTIQPRRILLMTAFDYNSVMLYGSDSFSRRPGLPTILKKDGSRLPDVYAKPGLSEIDITRINILYNCTAPRSHMRLVLFNEKYISLN